MCTHLTTYQVTVRTLHKQNDHNAELLGRLEAAVTEKDAEISRLRNEEMEKDLRLQAQHRNFQAQLSAEQNAREQVTNTLELMRQELEALKEAQSGPNPMDFSVMDNEDLNRERDRAEQEKRKLAEELEKAKTEYEQALACKNREVSLEIEGIKARFTDGLRDHYHQAMAREMINSHPTLSYVAYKSEVLKTLGPNVKPRSITTSKLETSDADHNSMANHVNHNLFLVRMIR